MCRKLSCVSLAVVVCALALACKRDADVGAVLDELDSFTREIVKRVESNPNTSAGVDDAQKYFDSRKDEIKGKLASLKNVSEAQVSEETRKKVKDSSLNNSMSVDKLRARYVGQTIGDPALRGKLEKLSQDYNALLLSVGM